MSTIERNIALPLRRNLNTFQLSAGGAIALAGAVLAVGHLFAAL